MTHKPSKKDLKKDLKNLRDEIHAYLGADESEITYDQFLEALKWDLEKILKIYFKGGVS